MFVAAVALQLLLAGCVGAQEAGEYIITTVAGGMSGELVANATKINEPSGVATDQDGNVFFVADYRIWRLNVTTGRMFKVADGPVFDQDGGGLLQLLWRWLPTPCTSPTGTTTASSG